jgi:hypothetical protein
MWLLRVTTHFAARRSRPFHADLVWREKNFLRSEALAELTRYTR